MTIYIYQNKISISNLCGPLCFKLRLQAWAWQYPCEMIYQNGYLFTFELLSWILLTIPSTSIGAQYQSKGSLQKIHYKSWKSHFDERICFEWLKILVCNWNLWHGCIQYQRNLVPSQWPLVSSSHFPFLRPSAGQLSVQLAVVQCTACRSLN